jgi:hypothetical protein
MINQDSIPIFGQRGGLRIFGFRVLIYDCCAAYLVQQPLLISNGSMRSALAYNDKPILLVSRNLPTSLFC